MDKAAQRQKKSVQVRGARLLISTELRPLAAMSCMLWAAPFICCTHSKEPEHARHGPGLSCLPYSEWAPLCPNKRQVFIRACTLQVFLHSGSNTAAVDDHVQSQLRRESVDEQFSKIAGQVWQKLLCHVHDCTCTTHWVLGSCKVCVEADGMYTWMLWESGCYAFCIILPDCRPRACCSTLE